MFQNIGFTELLLIAVVALVLFGPQKLPEIGRVLGRAIRDFKKGAHALLNDESEEAAAPKPAAQVKPDPQVSTQVRAASSNPFEADATSERAAVEFVTTAPSLVKSSVEPSTAAPEVAESDTAATAEPEAVQTVVQLEQAAVPVFASSVDASFAQSGSTAATAASVPSAAAPAVEAPSVTPTAPARTDAQPASTAAPQSSTRRLPD
ncbi:twin-arginine translocase TatA/TatE family subunit [Paenibacillus andongensis]|uniref:twin-arginine translocase TatA/TatE family subunit n=1 Tax=Paenibacillus andongensis TaxID=2975482 RepID=UPI0025B64522|nr:twin-arginine translocase TatA/TatE family subunit [Paenibacillus andongensis]